MWESPADSSRRKWCSVGAAAGSAKRRRDERRRGADERRGVDERDDVTAERGEEPGTRERRDDAQALSRTDWRTPFASPSCSSGSIALSIAERAAAKTSPPRP